MACSAGGSPASRPQRATIPITREVILEVDRATLPADAVFKGYDEATFNRLLTEHLPNLGPQQRKNVGGALAIAAYHAQTHWPIIQLLIVDDAPPFRGVTEALALCWVHEGRHYKKLMPFVPQHRVWLDAFLGDFWAYYHDLLAYREQSTLNNASASTRRSMPYSAR